MMFKATIITSVLIASGSVVFAQSGARRQSPTDNPAAHGAQGRTPVETRAPKPRSTTCAEFGPGFVKLEGSETCVKIGGGIGIGVGGGYGVSGGMR
mgnify:CR=1 FL=1|jgi:hypothetical protein